MIEKKRKEEDEKWLPLHRYFVAVICLDSMSIIVCWLCEHCVPDTHCPCFFSSSVGGGIPNPSFGGSADPQSAILIGQKKISLSSFGIGEVTVLGDKAGSAREEAKDWSTGKGRRK